MAVDCGDNFVEVNDSENEPMTKLLHIVVLVTGRMVRRNMTMFVEMI